MKAKIFVLAVVFISESTLVVTAFDGDFYNTKLALIDGCARAQGSVDSRSGSEYSSKLALRTNKSAGVDQEADVGYDMNYSSKKALLGPAAPEVEIAPVR